MALLANTDTVRPESDVSLDVYLHTTYSPECEYIDGHVRERNAGYCPHSAMMVVIAGMLGKFAKQTETVALMSVRVRASETCILVPDFCLSRRTQPRENIIVTPPLLCVEVLADDCLSQLQDRVIRFARMSVEHIWVIDEKARYCWYASPRGFVQPEDGVLRIEGTTVTLPLADIFAELNES